MEKYEKNTCKLRRNFLSQSATMLAAGAILPALPATARTGGSSGRFGTFEPLMPLQTLLERRSINGPDDTEIASELRTVVQAMMALPPEDPRNWYRQAIIHVLDCPHGNAWFFPWHRGYLYWFERIARKLTNNPNFALPYWDVTAFPQMSQVFFQQDPLDTRSPGYIHDIDTYRHTLFEPLKAYWKTFDTFQLQQLERRGFTNVDRLWTRLASIISTETMRTLTASNPLLPPHAQNVVSEPSLINSLAPQGLFSFGGTLTGHHNAGSGRGGLIESQLHNTVHGAVGGFMSGYLSASDPVFWLHHSNVDRLWDLWLERQGLDEQDGPAPWLDEPFLFFCDEDGMPVRSVAGDYVSSTKLNYRFQPSIPIGGAPVRLPDSPWKLNYSCELESTMLPIDGAVMAKVSPGKDACDALRGNYQSAIVIELDRPEFPASVYFQIEVRVVGADPNEFTHCGYATFFGAMDHQSHDSSPHVGSLAIGTAHGMGQCLKEAGPGAMDFEIALRLLRTDKDAPISPLEVKNISLTFL